MAGDADPIVLEILRSLQADLVATRQDLNALRAELVGRLGRIDDLARKDRRDIAGLLVSANALAGHMELRVSHIENRVARLEVATS